MLTDHDTNYLYLSKRLTNRRKFYSAFEKVLIDAGISFSLLPKTKDIWAVDYMPIQVDRNRFIQFRYEPDYLQNSADILTQTDPNQVCEAINIQTERSRLKIDGGNVIRGRDWVILTDKIFDENGDLSVYDVVNELEGLFGVRVIIIPKDPTDKIGHADSMVRFYDNSTILVNAYHADDNPDFQNKLKGALRDSGLKTIEIPYDPYRNPNFDDARGIYINYFHMNSVIVVPTFEMTTDDIAVRQFEDLFPDHQIYTLDSRSIAKDWGILNCITWNILRTKNEC